MSWLSLLIAPTLFASSISIESLQARATKQGFDRLVEVITQDTEICESYRHIKGPEVPRYEDCLQKIKTNAEAILSCTTSPIRQQEAIDFDAIQIDDVFGKFEKVSPPALIQKAFQKLTATADRHLPAQLTSRKWKLIGYNHTQPNATAAADGTIYLSRAFWEGTPFFTPDEVAAVLAHEIAHVTGHHSLRLGCQTLEWIGADNTIEVATRAFREDLTDGYPRKTAWKKLSQRFEYDADFSGAGLLLKSGQDPMAMVRLIEKIASMHGEGFTMGSHPEMKERISGLRKKILGME